MTKKRQYDGEYSGAALQAFVNGVNLRFVLTTILREHGLTEINPERWYDFELARSVYASVGTKVGAETLRRVGAGIIDAAPFPPGIDDPHSALAAVGPAYRMNIRGDDLGEIHCVRAAERRAQITFITPFPCALDQGILRGCCEKFGASPQIEHDAGRCRDDGGDRCSYTVSW